MAERSDLAKLTPIATVSHPITIDGRFIDDWGNHLNEAGAPKLFEEERLRMMLARGLTRERFLSEFGGIPLLSQQLIRYRTQVLEGENLTIVTNIYPYHGRVILFDQKMKRGENVAIDDLIEVVMVSPEGKLLRIPQEVIDAF